VLIEEQLREQGEEAVVGRAAHQGPEVDGVVLLPKVEALIGSWVRATVVDSDGVDLIASPGTGHQA
jgi:ribosomal protein S12 methylthiotransferase